MNWLKDHWELILSISGVSIFGIFGWVINRILKLNKLIRRAEGLIELSARMVETEKNLLSAFSVLNDSFIKLSQSVIQFPDSLKFRLISGVYWYVFNDGAHPFDSPICSKCLVNEKLPHTLIQKAPNHWECPNCHSIHRTMGIQEHINSLLKTYDSI